MGESNGRSTSEAGLSLAEHFRPSVCSRCDYALEGLALAGICPECGRPYGYPEICLYGHGEGRFANAWSRPKPKLSILILQWAVGLPVIVLLLGMRMRTFPSFVFWGFPMVIAAAIGTWRTLYGETADPVQVRLSPNGVNQSTRTRGPMPFGKMDDKAAVPWSKIGYVKLAPQNQGRVRVTMANHDKSLRLRIDYIDAVISCAPSSMTPLRDQIDVWQRQDDPRTK